MREPRAKGQHRVPFCKPPRQVLPEDRPDRPATAPSLGSLPMSVCSFHAAAFLLCQGSAGQAGLEQRTHPHPHFLGVAPPCFSNLWLNSGFRVQVTSLSRSSPHVPKPQTPSLTPRVWRRGLAENRNTPAPHELRRVGTHAPGSVGGPSFPQSPARLVPYLLPSASDPKRDPETEHLGVPWLTWGARPHPRVTPHSPRVSNSHRSVGSGPGWGQAEPAPPKARGLRGPAWCPGARCKKRRCRYKGHVSPRVPKTRSWHLPKCCPCSYLAAGRFLTLHGHPATAQPSKERHQGHCAPLL